MRKRQPSLVQLTWFSRLCLCAFLLRVKRTNSLLQVTRSTLLTARQNLALLCFPASLSYPDSLACTAFSDLIFPL